MPAARGSDQADAVLLHRLEGHQRRDGDDADQRDNDPPQHAHLRDVLARQRIGAFADRRAAQIEVRRQRERCHGAPAQQHDERHEQHMRGDTRRLRPDRHRGQHDCQRHATG